MTDREKKTPQKYYTKNGKERPPTLHEIICCEANVMDCEEAERIEGLIDTYYKSKVPKKKDGLIRQDRQDFCDGYNQAIADFHKEG